MAGSSSPSSDSGAGAQPCWLAPVGGAEWFTTACDASSAAAVLAEQQQQQQSSCLLGETTTWASRTSRLAASTWRASGAWTTTCGSRRRKACESKPQRTHAATWKSTAVDRTPASIGHNQPSGRPSRGAEVAETRIRRRTLCSVQDAVLGLRDYSSTPVLLCILVFYFLVLLIP